jgi:hypothetical protein
MARLYDLYDAGFDPNAIEASVPREPLPEDDYVLVVEKTELVANKGNTGYRLDITYKVEGGAHDGRKLFINYNVQHTSEQARQISLREFKSLIDATGVNPEAAFEDTDTLLYKPFLARVILKPETIKNGFGEREAKINPATGQPYPPRNSISAYKSLDGSVPPQPAPTPAPRAAAPAAAAAGRPATPPTAARPAAPQAGNPFGRR